MTDLLEFLSLRDANVRFVVLGTILLMSSASIVGTFTFLKKKSLLGDAIAHAVLPGVCLAFLLQGEKDPLWIIIGAFITGFISTVFIDLVVRKSKIKEDTAIALTLSTFFGFGILLLTYIQKSGNASQSGLDQFLFGKAAALVGSDLYNFATIAVILLVVVFLFYKELKLLAFDPDFARSIGLKVNLLELLLTSLSVMAVVTGIQAVGVVLMAAILITPAAAARYWTDRLPIMLVLAACFAAFSGLSGAYISYTLPRMPTGPWIVMVISLIAFFSFFFSPQKGIISRWWQIRKYRHAIALDNLLKTLYQLTEKEARTDKWFSFEEIIRKRFFTDKQLQHTLQKAKNKGFVQCKNEQVYLTAAGSEKGQRIVKLHRLFELYLTEIVKLAPDHVHDTADKIEHILTPELEARLEEKLNYPDKDPHDAKIPR